MVYSRLCINSAYGPSALLFSPKAQEIQEPLSNMDNLFGVTHFKDKNHQESVIT